MHYRGPRRRRERERPEKIFEEIIAENFPNMGKEIVNQVQEAQRVPGRINPRRNTLRHIVIKLAENKDRDKIIKATRDKQQTTYKGIPSGFLNRNSISQKGRTYNRDYSTQQNSHSDMMERSKAFQTSKS